MEWNVVSGDGIADLHPIFTLTRDQNSTTVLHAWWLRIAQVAFEDVIHDSIVTYINWSLHDTNRINRAFWFASMHTHTTTHPHAQTHLPTHVHIGYVLHRERSVGVFSLWPPIIMQNVTLLLIQEHIQTQNTLEYYTYASPLTIIQWTYVALKACLHYVLKPT